VACNQYLEIYYKSKYKVRQGSQVGGKHAPDSIAGNEIILLKFLQHTLGTRASYEVRTRRGGSGAQGIPPTWPMTLSANH
jgi:hypothetical protein